MFKSIVSKILGTIIVIQKSMRAYYYYYYSR